MNLKKVWNFIWNDDSLASWIVNIILAFIIIKFIFYPVIGLILGTTHPIVAVVSGSMEHGFTKEEFYAGAGNTETFYYMCGKRINEDKRVNFDVFWQECGPWYEEKGISKEQFSDFKMKNGFNKGDIIVLISKKSIKIGDVAVFWSDRPYPIIHRIIMESEEGYMTKGDHNEADDGFVKEENIVGKALFKIPYLGWIKIWFVEIISMIMKA